MNFGNGEGGSEARADGGLRDRRHGTGGKIAFGETRGAHARRKRQPGKGIELVIDIEGFEIGVGALADGEWRISAAVVEDCAEGLAIALVEAEETDLQIVLFVVGREAGLPSGVGGGAVFRGGDGNVVGIAVVVAAVVVEEGRHRSEEMGVECVQPGEEDSGVGFGLGIAQADAGVSAGVGVFKVVGIGIVGDLEEVAAKGGDKAELVGGIDVVDEVTETSDAVDGIVHDLRNGRLKSEIAAVAVDAGVVGEAAGVAAEAELIVGLVEVAASEDEFGVVVALEAGAGDDVEDAIGAVAELGSVTAAIDFDVVQILGIELGTKVLRDGGVDDGNAVEEPGGLVSAAHVQHVVGDVGSGDVVGDHGQAVGGVGAGRALDVLSADQGDGREAVGGDDRGRGRDGDIFRGTGHRQLEVDDGHGARDDDDCCELCAKPWLTALTEYSPRGTALNWNSPSAPVVAVFDQSEDLALSVTVAFCMGRCCGSCTTPRTAP